MDDYLVKIAENEAKITKLEKSIKASTDRLRKLRDENARLTYRSIADRYKTSGRALIDLLEREHQQFENIGSDDVPDQENADTDTADTDSADDADDDELAGQLSFDNEKPYSYSD